MIKVLLWDVDGTLLNFKEAEKIGIRHGFARFGYGECTNQMLADYSQINRRYWEMLERGEITKPQVYEGRFLEFFQKYAIPTNRISEFNKQYQIELGETICFMEGAPQILFDLAPHVLQYAVTNGSKVAQSRKLEKSGLNGILNGSFISEDVGAEKPSVAFFNAVWEKIGNYSPDEVLIVGDSLTSDMQGGVNAGIRTCWYCPGGGAVPANMKIEFRVQTLARVFEIVRRENNF